MWLYNDKEFDETTIDKAVGFVYRITNLENNKVYIGKKLFRFRKTKQKNKKKKRVLVESDWKTYFGSNVALQEDVKKLGEELFRREILHVCATKGICNYLELKEQILHGVLESDSFYNEYVGARIHKSHIRKLFSE